MGVGVWGQPVTTTLRWSCISTSGESSVFNTFIPWIENHSYHLILQNIHRPHPTRITITYNHHPPPCPPSLQPPLPQLHHSPPTLPQQAHDHLLQARRPHPPNQDLSLRHQSGPLGLRKEVTTSLSDQDDLIAQYNTIHATLHAIDRRLRAAAAIRGALDRRAPSTKRARESMKLEGLRERMALLTHLRRALLTKVSNGGDGYGVGVR